MQPAKHYCYNSVMWPTILLFLALISLPAVLARADPVVLDVSWTGTTAKAAHFSRFWLNCETSYTEITMRRSCAMACPEPGD